MTRTRDGLSWNYALPAFLLLSRIFPLYPADSSVIMTPNFSRENPLYPALPPTTAPNQPARHHSPITTPANAQPLADTINLAL